MICRPVKEKAPRYGTFSALYISGENQLGSDLMDCMLIQVNGRQLFDNYFKKCVVRRAFIININQFRVCSILLNSRKKLVTYKNEF